MLHRYRLPVRSPALTAVLLAAITSTAVVSAGAPAAAAAAPAPANLIVNGSFEDPAIWQYTDLAEYDGGATDMPGWTVGGDSVDLTAGSYWLAEDGQQSLDLSGAAPGSVAQSVATSAGQPYTLSWDLAGNTNCGQPVKTMHVSWDGALIESPSFDTAGDGNGAMGWTEGQVIVTATGSSSVVQFADATPDMSQCGAVLDNVSLVPAQISTPAFTQDSPTLTALQGSAYSAVFFASGVPAYSLVGAPSWLSVTAQGAVTGTPPIGTSTFSYSVSADNADGHALAGPFTVAVQAATTATGKLIDGGIAANPVAGASVQACVTEGGVTGGGVTGGGECQQAVTQDDGTFSVPVPVGASVVLSGYPVPLTGDVATSTEPMQVPAAGIENVTIALNGIAPISGGLEVNGSSAPTVYWADPSTATLSGCPDGLATVTVIGENTQTGAFDSDVVVLTEDPPDSGSYTGTIPPQEPVHGPVELESSVACPPQSPILPDSGPATGGTTVFVTGSGFTGATGVTFGGVPAASFTVLSDDGIEATVPPGSGSVQVAVQEGAAEVDVDQYTYQGVSGIYPASGPAAGGTWVVIDGTGFDAATEVDFGGSAAEFYAISDTQVEALSPPGSGTQDITVSTAFGGTTPTVAADRFTYGAASGSSGRPSARGSAAAAKPPIAASGPVRHSAAGPAPSSGAPGSAKPASAATMTLKILNYIYSKGPELLTDKSEIQAAISAALSALGPNCKDSQEALVQGISLAISPIVDAAVDVLLPSIEYGEIAAGLAAGPVGIALSILIFSLTPVALHYAMDQAVEVLIQAAVEAQLGQCPPEIPEPLPPFPPPPPLPGNTPPSTSFNPTGLVDPSGTVLDTEGNPIEGATTTILRADTAAGPYTPVDESSPGIEPPQNPETTGQDGTFHWDVSSGWYEVQASAPGCSAPDDPSQGTVTIGPYPVPPPQLGLAITMACPDEAPPPTPVVTGLDTGTGPPPGGTTVTVLGSGFTPDSTVDFGTTAATAVDYLSPGALTATSPAGTGPVDVTVHNAGTVSTASAVDRFFYGSTPTVTGVAASSGPVGGGTTVTVSGTGFTGADTVAFGGLPAASFTVQSATQITAVAPAEQVGTVDVQVETPAGTSAEAAADQYTYQGVAPALTADTPPAAGQVGTAYSYTYKASGTPAPTFSVASGALPPGLTLGNATGLLSGSPTKTGTYTFTVAAANGAATPATGPATTVTVAPGRTTVRLAGGIAIETAVAVSQYDFADNGAATDGGRDAQGRIQAQAVVLSRSDVFYDALAGSAMAAQKKSPLLITPPSALNPAVQTEIERILPEGGTVYLLGGTQALSQKVQDQVQALGYQTVRFAGTNLYDTATLIDQAITAHPAKVIVATGVQYYDALSAGAAAGATPGTVVVLTQGTSMPAVSAQYLDSIAPGLTDAYGAGGPGNTALDNAVHGGQVTWPNSITLHSEVGQTAPDTSLLLAAAFFTNPPFVAVATSRGWYDALTGGAAAGLDGGPLLLTAPTSLYGPDATYISTQSKSGLYTAAVLGGTSAMPAAVFNQIQAALEK